MGRSRFTEQYWTLVERNRRYLTVQQNAQETKLRDTRSSNVVVIVIFIITLLNFAKAEILSENFKASLIIAV